MSDAQTLTAAHTPTVYFIDDSATMREVIKIAFRKENIRVITCPDAASALAQFGEAAPDAVITDVIMPDQDGYEVCQFIKQHEQFGRTPVILMSGVVNRTVAEKALAVKADDLIRKPFQPHDLIVRIKNLLGLNSPAPAADEVPPDSSQAALRPAPPAGGPPPQTLSSLFAAGPTHAPAAVASARPNAPDAPAHRTAAPPAAEIQKLRNEVRRLEFLVKKLEAELEAEHKYCAALEAHFKTLQESE
jgi:DNA-binding response OmpR family regulator